MHAEDVVDASSHVLSQEVQQHAGLHSTLHCDSVRILIHLYGE